MTDIIYSIIIPVIFFVMPICFIVYGLINKRNSFAGYLLMVGCFFLSLPLSVYITPAVSGLICYFLSIIGISASFSDTTILSMILIVFLVYIAYKLYYIFLYWESRNYTQTVKELVFLGQKKDLPDCKEIILKTFKERILHAGKFQKPKDAIVFSEKQLYLTTLSMLSSGKYNFLYGDLTDEGKQLVHISEYCVDRLVDHGIIPLENREEYLYSIKKSSISGTLLYSLSKEQ